ncbi:MAG: hypothetical protein ACTSYG_10590, partial [Candidatus Heimdallarchaeota archaeon]
MAEKKEEGAFEGINEPYKDTEEAFSEIPPPPNDKVGAEETTPVDQFPSQEPPEEQLEGTIIDQQPESEDELRKKKKRRNIILIIVFAVVLPLLIIIGVFVFIFLALVGAFQSCSSQCCQNCSDS